MCEYESLFALTFRSVKTKAKGNPKANSKVQYLKIQMGNRRDGNFAYRCVQITTPMYSARGYLQRRYSKTDRSKN